MSSRGRRYRDLPLSVKMSVLYSLVFALLFIVSILLITGIAQRHLVRMVADTYDQSLAGMLERVDGVLKDMEKVSRFTLSDRRLQDIVARENKRYDQQYLDDQEWLDQFFHNAITLQDNITSIRLISLNSVVFKYNRNYDVFADGYDYQRDDWFDEAALMGGRPVMVGANLPADVQNNRDVPALSKYVVSVARQINAFRDQPVCIGYIKIDTSLPVIADILSIAPADSQIYLVDQNGRIVYAHDPALLTQPVELVCKSPELFSHSSGNFTDKTADGPYFAAYHVSDYSGWSILLMLPNEMFMQPARTSASISILIMLAALVLSALFSMVAARALTKPVRLLQQGMAQVERGNLNHYIAIRSGDEIGRLTESFNAMTARLSDLIESEYGERIRRQEAELRYRRSEMTALQNQINPHFLYNTLDTIRIKAALEGNTEVSSMIMTLSKMFRQSTYRGDGDIRTLLGEMEFVRSFIALYRYRYGDRIVLRESLQPGTLSCAVIPFLLQPLVENSLQHGIELSGQRGCVHIQARIWKKYLLMRISDNGKGMPEALRGRYNRIFSGAEPMDGIAEHIGLMNVYQRIALKYGDACRLRLHRASSGGLTVLVALPAEAPNPPCPPTEE